MGSTVSLTEGLGSARQSIFYDAWGNERDRIGTSANKFTFTGHEKDKETGLIYAKARFYDADIGRFLNQDELLGDVNNPPSLHRYFYVMQNPLRFGDPTGNQPICIGPDCTRDRNLNLVDDAGALETAIARLERFVGFADAFLSNFTVGLFPRTEARLAPSEAFLEGQLAGDFASQTIALGETALGLKAFFGGGAAAGGAAVTGVGVVFAIPAGGVAITGGFAALHGPAVFTTAQDAKALTQGELSSRQGKTIKESPTGDQAVPQPGQKPNTGSKPITEPAKTKTKPKGQSSARPASSAADSNATQTRVLTQHRSGNAQVELSGQRWHLPAGSNSSRIPKVDSVGDQLQRAVTKESQRWSPSRLSTPESQAIAKARTANEPWRGNLLEAQAKGRWVESRVRQQFPDLRWNRTGVDAVDPSTGIQYEILSGTRSNLDRHAKRMSDAIFRMITF